LPWLEFKTSRIAVGLGHLAFELSGVWAGVLLGLWLLLVVLPKGIRSVALGLMVLAWGLVIWAGASGLLHDGSENERVSLGAGFWLTLLALYVGLFATYRQQRAWALWPALTALGVLIWVGAFGQVGPAIEWLAWREQFGTEVWRHLALAGSAVIQATLVGVPLGVLATRGPQFAWVLGVSSFLQTIPSLALFGLLLPLLSQLSRSLNLGTTLAILAVGALMLRLFWAASPRIGLVASVPLMLLFLVLGGTLLFNLLGPDPLKLALNAPLSEAGVRGIGTAPAVLALTLYALLPLVNGTYAGLKAVPEAARDAGRGMGMSGAQLFWRVELPLALPLILEGIRSAAVLALGITTVAALIGAGGLGYFILRGADSGAPDMVLLGALPVIVLALLTDALLRWAGLGLRQRLGT
jgi:osmoprotectant transport system permease protein